MTGQPTAGRLSLPALSIALSLIRLIGVTPPAVGTPPRKLDPLSDLIR